MSQATKILTELERRGVIVALDGDTLSLKPRRSLDDALLARVREAKPAILEALRSRPATCAASCYEIDAGRWIRETCWHCHGEKECGCIVCWQAVPSECVVCKGSGQVWRWVQ